MFPKMVDVFTEEQRSLIMSKIKSKNTKLELSLKKFLIGFDYQPNLFGRPDFVNYKNKTIIFVDGCFWHQCPIHSKTPKQNKEYWIPKLKRNILRAKEVDIAYKNSDWKVIRIWEHELRGNLNKVIKKKIKEEKFKISGCLIKLNV